METAAAYTDQPAQGTAPDAGQRPSDQRSTEQRPSDRPSPEQRPADQHPAQRTPGAAETRPATLAGRPAPTTKGTSGQSSPTPKSAAPQAGTPKPTAAPAGTGTKGTNGQSNTTTGAPGSGSGNLGSAAGPSAGMQVNGKQGPTKALYVVQLDPPPGASAPFKLCVVQAADAMQKSVDVLGFGRSDPPPPPNNGKTPDKVQAAAVEGSGKGVDLYKQQVASAGARQDSMVDMDAQVDGTAQMIAAEQAQTLYKIQHIRNELQVALDSVGTKKLKAPQEAKLMDHLEAAVTKVHDLVKTAQDVNSGAAGGGSGSGSSGGGAAGGGAAGGAGAAQQAAAGGGLGSMLPMLAMLPMALMPMLGQLPELLGKKDDEDEEDDDEAPPSQPAPGPAPTATDPTAPAPSGAAPPQGGAPQNPAPSGPQTEIPYGPTTPNQQV
ncbi:hypothetical protein [Nocardia sp. NPDC019395]|uniref:hypothetical protein n=1 Tax=Nocardia sp. NPDC019395 TaxID=3154686 RepID=UPI0033E94CBA